MKFKDLKFIPHEIDPNGIQARHDFKNGFGVSVIKTLFSYGRDNDLYEVGIMEDGRLTYSTEITQDVLGYQSEADIDEILKRVEELDAE